MMTRDEKIETLENFCDKWVLCSDGCPFWKKNAEDYDCRWHDMDDKTLDECINFIDSNNAKEQIVTPSYANPDMVNHPAHYCQGGIECIDAIKAATINKRGIEAVCVANVIKYLWRYEEKNGKEDVEKAKWYLEYLLKELNVARKGEDTSFDYDFSDDIVECSECKYNYIEFEDDGMTWGEPCKSCKNGILPDSPEYKTAKLKWEPKENK